MKKLLIVALAILMASCVTNQNSNEGPTSEVRHMSSGSSRVPTSASDLSGSYLGEGYYPNRASGLNRPAIRVYLDKSKDENDTYYGAIVEYDHLMLMALPYLSANNAPALNKVFGYLDKISTRISAYKFVPGSQTGTYTLHNLTVIKDKIVPSREVAMTLILNLNNNSEDKFAGAFIRGNVDGDIYFPDANAPSEGFFSDVRKIMALTQYKLARAVYKLGNLSSTWRENNAGLEGSYLSEYGRRTDGVLELYNENGKSKAKFIRTNKTKARDFTNPKSAMIAGDYIVSEPIPKMYILKPVVPQHNQSNAEMGGRIGLFLDVFDASAPEAGGHMVTELAFTSPNDPEDFMMYYQHPEHLKNVGVEPRKK